jgi:hypothetical protein
VLPASSPRVRLESVSCLDHHHRTNHLHPSTYTYSSAHPFDTARHRSITQPHARILTIQSIGLAHEAYVVPSEKRKSDSRMSGKADFGLSLRCVVNFLQFQQPSKASQSLKRGHRPIVVPPVLVSPLPSLPIRLYNTLTLNSNPLPVSIGLSGHGNTLYRHRPLSSPRLFAIR